MEWQIGVSTVRRWRHRRAARGRRSPPSRAWGQPAWTGAASDSCFAIQLSPGSEEERVLPVQTSADGAVEVVDGEAPVGDEVEADGDAAGNALDAVAQGHDAFHHLFHRLDLVGPQRAPHQV